MNVYFGPWEIVAGEEGERRERAKPPDGALATIALRTRTAGVQHGIVVMPDGRELGTDYEPFGSLDETLTGQARDRLASMLGITETVESVRLIDLLWDAWTIYSDPVGGTGFGTLVPAIRRGGARYELPISRLGMVRTAACRPSGDLREQANWAKTLAKLQINLMAVRERSLAGDMIDPVTKQVDETYHQRVMQAEIEKYGLPFEALRPPEWPIRETPKPRQTTISDTFDGTDGDTIGTLLTWAEVSNDWDRVSNAAELVTAAADSSARAESDLSSDDHYAQAVVTKLSNTNADRWAGPCCRFSASAETFYVARIRGLDGSYQVFKCEAGSYTALGTPDDETETEPYTLKISANGTTIEKFFGGTSRESFTDASIDTNLRCGIGGNSGNSSNRSALDDFEAADLGGGTTTLTAEAAAFTLTGQTAALRHDRRLNIGAGAFTFAGQDADLRVEGALTADAGSFALAGQDAGLQHDRKLIAAAVAFVLDGQDAGLRRSLPLDAEAAAFVLSGQDAALRHDRRLGAECGVFTLSGKDAGLTYSGAPAGVATKMTLTGVGV